MRTQKLALMNKFKFYFIVLCSVVTLFSCNNVDTPTSTALRDFDEQYATDITTIEDFLNTHYLEVTSNQDVTMTKIEAGDTNHSAIMTLLNGATFPKLLFKEVTLNSKIYKIYYLKIREDFASGKAPSRVDGVLTSYRGSYLQYVYKQTPKKDSLGNIILDSYGNPVLEDYVDPITNAKVIILANKDFEYNPYPTSFFGLDKLIQGWGEIFPLFKSGVVNPASGNDPVSYSDFGAGVMFIPSGLGYFNKTQTDQNGVIKIPGYSPLIFSFKLYDVSSADQDGDGVFSNDEDTNHDGVFTNDDSDGDGIQDYLDYDDDGDGVFTKVEIKNPATGLPFPFNEIPVCTSGKKNYLDPTCHP